MVVFCFMFPCQHIVPCSLKQTNKLLSEEGGKKQAWEVRFHLFESKWVFTGCECVFHNSRGEILRSFPNGWRGKIRGKCFYFCKGKRTGKKKRKEKKIRFSASACLTFTEGIGQVDNTVPAQLSPVTGSLIFIMCAELIINITVRRSLFWDLADRSGFNRRWWEEPPLATGFITY